MSHTPVNYHATHHHQQLKDQLLFLVLLLTLFLLFLLAVTVLSVWWLCMMVLEWVTQSPLLCMLPVVLILVFLVLAIVLTELSKRAVEPQQPVSQVSAVHCSLLVLLFLPSVASPPTAVMVNRTGINSVLVSWSAPSSAPAGYEVFYQVAGGSTLSGGNTSNTELTLTGLTLGESFNLCSGIWSRGRTCAAQCSQ